MEPTTTPTLGQTIVVPANLADMIVKTPGTCGGRARIAGTRIKVEHVYNWVEHQGMSPAQVVKEFPHLTKAQAYCDQSTRSIGQIIRGLNWQTLTNRLPLCSHSRRVCTMLGGDLPLRRLPLHRPFDIQRPAHGVRFLALAFEVRARHELADKAHRDELKADQHADGA
jgi:uncharacterized protein (DUF433 family)